MKKSFYLSLLFISSAVFAQVPKLTGDLLGGSNMPNKLMVVMDANVYFFANDGIKGKEIWKSDGTTAGTVLLKDINPASGNGIIYDELVKVGNKIFFCASEPATGIELWKTDGTGGGTQLVKDIETGSEDFRPRNLKAFNNTLYFTNNEKTEIWKSDGTSVGTVLVKALAGNVYIREFIPCGNTFYFVLALISTGEEQLWKTDGTSAGTIMLKQFLHTFGHTAFNNTLFFSGNDGISGSELWKSDGTTAGTLLVKDLNPGSFGSSLSYLTVFNSLVYFSASGTIYKTDGTSGGTVLVSELDGYYLTQANGSLYFVDYTDGTRIFKSDGTAGGMVMLKKFERYDNLSMNYKFIGTNYGIVYFTSKDVDHGEELWKTNGTPAGTVLAADLRPGVYSGFPHNFATEDGSIIYFTAMSAVEGVELWKITQAGPASLVKDIEPNVFDSNPENLAALNNFLFFSAKSQNSTSLYIIDTSNPNMYPYNKYINSPSNFLAFNNKMYFQAENYLGKELFVSNGNVTDLVKDIFVGDSAGIKNSSRPTELTAVGSNFYFAATNNHDRELWKSDGTDAGTVLVKNINSSGSSNPNHLIEFNGSLYFFATANSNTVLYKSDGSSAGTNAIQYPIAIPYIVDTLNGQIAKTNTALYIQVKAFTTGSELFKLDGTSLVLVKDIYSGGFLGAPNNSNPSNFTPINDRLYFTATTASGTELWKSDGTEASTVMIKDIWEGSSSSGVSNLINFNGTLYFSANNGTNGLELWKSDGTLSGTVMVKDINPGSVGSNPSQFCVVGNTLYFSAFHPKYGTELWKTDGTAQGTRLVYDLYTNYNNESNNSNPAQLFTINGILFFTADDGLAGNELFYFKPCPSTESFSQYTYPPNHSYHVTNSIEAEHKIMYGKTVNYLAGKSILLKPGFGIDAKAEAIVTDNIFLAEIKGCN